MPDKKIDDRGLKVRTVSWDCQPGDRQCGDWRIKLIFGELWG